MKYILCRNRNKNKPTLIQTNGIVTEVEEAKYRGLITDNRLNCEKYTTAIKKVIHIIRAIWI